VRLVSVRHLLLLVSCLFPALALAEPIDFRLPAQSAADALLAFSQQARIEIIFSFDDLNRVRSNETVGRYEPEVALSRLLQGTGFSARRDERGKFVVAASGRQSGSVHGRILTPAGAPAAGISVRLFDARQTVTTGADGQFDFVGVLPGTYRLIANGPGYQTLDVNPVRITANYTLTLPPQTLRAADDPLHMDPYVVEGESARLRPIGRSRYPLMDRTPTGNLDLFRTENDALPYVIYDREQITRSGVVNLNEFLQRELLDGNSATLPSDQNADTPAYVSASFNLSMRGDRQPDETVVLVNGRRLPEILTGGGVGVVPPDVNIIPLGLVQQVQVLPISASALYSGNPVGGVVNIILRPDANATEVTATYTNALAGFDAPSSSVTLQHGETLLGGRLKVRLTASFTDSVPPTEAELGYRSGVPQLSVPPGNAIFGATPNIRSADGSPLAALGNSPVTSVAPGANGSGGLAAFAGRSGVRNQNLFDSPGDFSVSATSLDYPYGRRQERAAFFGSATYDATPWLQIGFDGLYARTVVNPGYNVLHGDLEMAAGSAFNPFHQDILISLNDVVPQLGENYSEAHIESFSGVLGLLFKLSTNWRLSLDGQYGRNFTHYRGLAGVDTARWQELVDTGRYNPFRDTQVHAPSQDFYDRALVFFGSPGQFVKRGDYETLDLAARVTNQKLALPTGLSTLNLGADYRRTHLADYLEQLRYADGSPAADPAEWQGRTLERTSLFGELQAPLIPTNHLPSWLAGMETDLAGRYIMADTSKETNFAPTLALKVDFTGGFSLRGSVTTASRFSTPQMSRPPVGGGGGPGGINATGIYDPLRNERYEVEEKDAVNPNVLPEEAVTQTVGMIFQRGEIHRLRASLDFVDTRKTNEILWLTSQGVINVEESFPERVIRNPLAPGDPAPAGRIRSVITGPVNTDWRHSQNWNVSLDYAWTRCAGGTLEAYARLVYFPQYELRLFPDSEIIDELNEPDGAFPGILKYRANFGAGWSNRRYGFGVDGHYYHSRTLSAEEQQGFGREELKPYWQFDAYLQSDLSHLLPGNANVGEHSRRFGLRAQLRVNNIFGFDYPRYSVDTVQPYGDWRGRTYSISLTASF
jgi:outer membrane receptor protein involved in Fe transport